MLAYILLLFAVPACAGDSGTSAAQPVLTVAAAADLQNAFSELGPIFTRETGAKVVFQFGSSGVMAKQIEQGAPVDVFVSADEAYTTDVVSTGAGIAGTERVYALGRIALVTHDGSAFTPTSLADLTRPEVKHIALANPEHAPYGRAAKEALTKAGLWDKVAAKIVYAENVSQALQFVQTGNADAGIVAQSLSGTAGVTFSPVDGTLYAPLRQALVVVKTTKQERLARAFADFVSGDQGRSLLERYGFGLPEAK